MLHCQKQIIDHIDEPEDEVGQVEDNSWTEGLAQMNNRLAQRLRLIPRRNLTVALL